MRERERDSERELLRCGERKDKERGSKCVKVFNCSKEATAIVNRSRE